MSNEYKGYNIVMDGTYGMYNIKSVGRGSVPKELAGSFTTPEIAKIAVDTYGKRTSTKEEKEGGKTVNS